MSAFRRFLAVWLALGVAGGGLAAAGRARGRGDAPPGGLARFARLTFGAGAPGAIAARSIPAPGPEEAFGPPPAAPLVTTEYRTPNGWLLRPAGAQVDTRRAPTGVALSPDGAHAYVVTSGTADEALTTVDTRTLVATHALSPELYMGVAADGAGNVWASGGGSHRLYQFKTAGPASVPTRAPNPVPTGPPNRGVRLLGYPGNMLLRGSRLYVVGNLSVPSSAVQAFDPAAGPCPSSPICSVLGVVDVSDPDREAPPVHLVPVGRDAYGIAASPDGTKLYVSNWADDTNPARGGTGTVSVVDVSTPGAEREVQVVGVGRHPTGLALSPDGRTLVVANTADDTITVLSVGEDGLVVSGTTKSVRTTPDAPRGAAPLAVSWSPGGDLLYVALAGQNAVEVRTPSGDPIPRTVAVGGRTLAVPHTYIPTGWYPSALLGAPHPGSRDTSRLYVTNLKGIGAGPGYNAYAPPGQGSRSQGTLSVIDVPGPGPAREAQLDRWTATVVENNGWVPIFDPAARSAAADPCLPAPLPAGGTTFSQLLCDAWSGRLDPSPFHVVYIVKENKTFDQYFGDIQPTLPDADADPTFLLYGEAVTTNQHRLARLFTVSDRFWADSEQSTTGHQWTSAGYATAYVEITWNPEYSQGLRGNRGGGGYAPGQSDPEVARQEGELSEPEERLVDLLADPARNPRGLTFRVYSDDVNEGSGAKGDQVPLDKWGLRPSPFHRGRDLDFPDTDRARLFIHGQTVSNAWSLDRGGPPPGFGQVIAFTPEERARFSLAGWEDAYRACRQGGGDDTACQRAMPNVVYMALPVDHTLGFNPLAPTPASMVADNDYAVGLIVEALSRSPFWRTTLVLITEDDTQAAGDHVDSHRTFLLTAGGLARRHGPQGRASHQEGSFPSILKTIEVLFGLPPLTIYDRAAVPLHDVVVGSLAEANDEVYEAVRPPTPFLRNPEEGELAELSARLDWRVDRTDPALLRDLLYAGLRGWPLPERSRRLLAVPPER